MGKVIPFPIQVNIHWNGRPLTEDEIKYVREFLLSVSRRVRIKRIRFSGVDFYGNDIKAIIDQLYEKHLILEEEKQRIYQKLEAKPMNSL